MNTPTHIPAIVDEQEGQLIAYETSASPAAGGFVRDGAPRSRWTELSVWYLHHPHGRLKRWAAVVTGRTNEPGEHDRVNVLVAGTLDRALKIVEQFGIMGVVAAETARQWADDNRVAVERDRAPLSLPDDAAALGWLYGEPDEGHTGYAKMLSRDLEAGESAVRMQLKAGRPVMVPLRSVLPFVDRAAFRRAREASRG